MKRILSAAIAVAMLAPAVPALAQPGGGPDRGGEHGGDRGGDHGGDHGGGERGGDHGRGGPGGDHGGAPQFRRGEHFDRGRAVNYGELDYRQFHGMRRPPRGYHWVRNGDDALLVGITSGIIASVIVGATR